MRFPIGIRVFGGFLLVIVLTGLISVIAIDRYSDFDSTLRAMAEKEIPEVRILWKVKSLLTEMEFDLQYVFSDDESEQKEKHIRDLLRKEENVKKSLAEYRNLHPVLFVEEKRLLEEIASYRLSLERATVDMIALARQGQNSKAKAFLAGAWGGAYQVFLESLDRLLDYENRQVEDWMGAIRNRSLSDQRMLLALQVAVILTSLALAVWITFSVRNPVTKLVKATDGVEQGDLTSKAEIVSNDEIGFLAHRFNEMVDRLNRSRSEQRRFYADASHELRTPLTIIRGEAEVALRGEESVKDYREALEVITGVVSQMGNLVDELLFLARSEAGQIRYQIEEVAMAPLLEEAVHQSQGMAALQGVDLELDTMTPIAVRGDIEHLRQLVIILIDNAIKYTSSGGKAALAVEVESDWARMLVSDTGNGISEEDLPHVFERFYRGDASRTRHERGTGLGLSIAKSIVQAQMGTILIESVLGRGTTVTVALPLVRS